MATCISKTPPPGNVGCTEPLDHLNFEQLNFDIAAVTDTSALVDGGCTPSHSNRSVHIPNGSLDPASRAARDSDSHSSTEALIGKLKRDLETNYDIQANHRLQKFLSQHSTGVPDEEGDLFKQKEAIERTKFIVYKGAQVAKLINELTGSHRDPLATPTTPTSSSYRRRAVTDNHFKVGHQFPPPRSLHDRSVKTSSSGISFGSLDSMSSANSGSTSHAGMNDKTSLPSTTDGADTTTGWTREQIVQAFSATWDYIVATQNESAQLKSEITDLKQLLIALTGGGGDSGHNDLCSRITALEDKISAIHSGQPLESESAFVANLASDIAKLRLEVANANVSDTLSKRAFETENELTKMSFNNKCALIEKYLGIDITTTGPKPHDVLEALHRRIWHLEEYLPMDDSARKVAKGYRPLNEYMKATLGRGNTIVNYRATPGYSGGAALGDTSSTCVDPTPSDIIGNAFTNQGTGGTLSGTSLTSTSAAAYPFSQAGSGKRFLGNGTFISHMNMRFDPADVRHRKRAHNIGGRSAISPENLPPTITKSEFLHSAALPGLLPQGIAIPSGPKALNNSENQATSNSEPPIDIIKSIESPPRRARGSTVNTESRAFGVVSPKTRKTTGRHSRTNSTSTTKEAASDAAPQKTKDRAYQAWLNQQSGSFIGKKLIGLGQKD
jgi:hypothetical protein